MTMTMRGILQGSATAMGAVVLLLGATACTGDAQDDPAGDDSPTQQEPASGEDGADATDQSGIEAAPSDGGGESPYDDEQLDAASQRFVDILQVLDDQDWEAACGMVLDPTTGTAPEGDRLQECVDGLEPMKGELAGQLEPGAFDGVDASMITATDNGDGTVSLSVLGEDLGIPMTLADDGSWYLVIPF